MTRSDNESSLATTRQLCLLRQRVATNDLMMRLLTQNLRLVAGDYHLQRVASDDKGLRPHQSLLDSAESLATNFNDARLSSRPAESSSAKPKTTQTATIRQETTSRTAFWTLPNRLPGI